MRRSAGQAKHRPAGPGFTLIEVLVTLVIVGAAAAIILAHLRTLIDLNMNAQAQRLEAEHTLNQVALLPMVGLPTARVRVKGDHLDLQVGSGAGRLAEVRNFVLPEEDPVPIDQAYTAFQRYRIAPDSRFPMTLIQRSLSPPSGEKGAR